MPNEVDKSLLERLQALRGASADPDRHAPTTISIDLIERKKTPTREDALSARLKLLRSQSGTSPASSKASPQPDKSRTPAAPASPLASKSKPKNEKSEIIDDEVDALFQTDDQTLEELLGDVGPDEGFQVEPDDAQVKALLEELADSIPKDDDSKNKEGKEDEKAGDSDDSEGEGMNSKVEDVIARFRDEIDLEKALGKDIPIKSIEPEDDDDAQNGQETNSKESDLDIPDVPTTTSDPPRQASKDLDNLTARMAALRAASTKPDDDGDAASFMPDIPPLDSSGKPINRLTSKTGYTDDDMDSWCTVCLEDATLRCLGCDDDVYCTRCWREMHIGPSAGFDERSHRAVQFTKDKKKRVMLGA